MPDWEYIVAKVKRSEHTEDVLNEWGKKGWECFQVCMVKVASPVSYVLYLKRRLS